MWTNGESRWSVHKSSLYYPCDFSIYLRLLPNKMLPLTLPPKNNCSRVWRHRKVEAAEGQQRGLNKHQYWSRSWEKGATFSPTLHGSAIRLRFLQAALMDIGTLLNARAKNSPCSGSVSLTRWLVHSGYSTHQHQTKRDIEIEGENENINYEQKRKRSLLVF